MNDKIKNELQISVAGIRGIYPEYLTSEIVFNFGIIFGSFIKANEVFICSDTRISGQSLKDSAITGLLCSGKDVIDIGIAATPEIGYIIEKRGESSAGLYYSTTSCEYNGIKVFFRKGTFFNAEEMGRMP